MAALSLLCAVALAAVFGVSGVAKLADRDATRQAVAGFGVRASRTRAVAALLAPAELVVAVALIVPATTTVGLILSLLLLGGFTRAIAMAMMNGRRPDCRCFGRIGGADISGRTVARNVALAMIAVYGLAARGGGWSDLGTGRLTAAIAGGLVIAATIVGVEGVAGRVARLRRERVEGLAFDREMEVDLGPGDVAPAFILPSLAGGQVSSDALFGRGGRPTLLMFLSPGCGPCRVLRAAALRWVLAYGDRLQVAVVAPGEAATNRADYLGADGLTVLLDGDGAVRAAYGVHGAPAAVLVDGDGRFIGPLASGEPLVRRLLAAALLGRDVEAAADAPAEEITGESVLQPRVTVTSSPTEDGVVLVDEATGASVSLDGIGKVVWSVLDGTSALGDIIDDLASAFGAPREVVEHDTLTLARSLGAAGMFDGVAPGVA